MGDEPAAAATLAPLETAGAAGGKKSHERPHTIGDGRNTRGVDRELEMLGRLGSQAQIILQLALAVEGEEHFSSFADYLAFRGKISEFEAFCNIIETHLKDVVTDRRKELEDRFYSLWSIIFRPSLRALTRFFARLVDEEVLPLGGRDLLEAEIRSLSSMRSVLAAPRFGDVADRQMLDELGELEAMIAKLAERATSLPDFSQQGVVSPDGMAAEADAVRPAAAAPPPLAATAMHSDLPNLKAVHELRALLDNYKRDRSLRQYVDIDTRAVDEIERKFLVNPVDPAAVVWMRQICNAWVSRLRDNDKDVRRVIGMIRSG